MVIVESNSAMLLLVKILFAERLRDTHTRYKSVNVLVAASSNTDSKVVETALAPKETLSAYTDHQRYLPYLGLAY